MSILKWLGLERTASEDEAGRTETVRRIVDALERIEPERARHIAAFAYLLGRVAHADRATAPEEVRLMERIVMDRGSLPEDLAVLVVQIARTQNMLFGGTEDFLVAREFGQSASVEEKLALLDCLYAVSAADRSITTVEDNEIARVAAELRIEHADLVRARVAYKEYLRVLQG